MHARGTLLEFKLVSKKGTQEESNDDNVHAWRRAVIDEGGGLDCTVTHEACRPRQNTNNTKCMIQTSNNDGVVETQ